MQGRSHGTTSHTAAMVRTGVVGGLIGGIAMGLLMMVVNAVKGMGFWAYRAVGRAPAPEDQGMGDAPEEEHAQHWMALMAFDFFHPVLHRSRYQRVWLQAAASRILQRYRGDAGEAGRHLALRLGRVVPR